MVHRVAVQVRRLAPEFHMHFDLHVDLHVDAHVDVHLPAGCAVQHTPLGMTYKYKCVSAYATVATKLAATCAVSSLQD